MTNPRFSTLGSTLALLCCVALFSGCKKPPEPAKKKVAKVETPSPAAEDAGAEGDTTPDAGPAVDAGPQKPKPNPPPEEAPEHLKAAPADAQKSKSKLAWKQLYAGYGKDNPSRDDTVFIHHATWKTDGKRVANTWRKKSPKILKMSKLLPGWREGLSKMVVGERLRLWIPEKLALARSQRKRGKKGMRIVDIELLRLKIAPKAPEDVRKPPKDALKAKGGLRWKPLNEGTGKVKPKRTDMVTVKYAGWTKKGECFDHTDHDETMTFPLLGVIEGWTEGLQLMVEGQKARFWIPKKMAYDGEPRKPKGMLVFDIELLKIGQ